MADGLSLLETLTDTAIDSALGYEKAAEKATNAGSRLANHCATEGHPI